MRVRVRLFAQLRERAGRAELELELPEGARVADALAALADVAGDLPVVLAVNRRYADRDAPLAAGDELALVPPVSGGAERVRLAELTDAPLDVDAARRLVVDPACGAVVLFTGTTRDVERLEYEAYPDMARERIAALAAEVAERHGLVAVAVAHRVGSVPLSEPSVVIAVSAPHRQEAFAGARELLDAVKAQAPIWKKEHSAEGESSWVEGSLPTTEG